MIFSYQTKVNREGIYKKDSLLLLSWETNGEGQTHYVKKYVCRNYLVLGTIVMLSLIGHKNGLNDDLQKPWGKYKDEL